MINIVIIEDNTYARTAWESAFDSEDDLVVLGSFASCEEALESDAIGNAEVFLLDIGLPGMSGIECAEKISEINGNALIIMVSIQEDDHSIFTSLQSGAIGYLHKSVSPEELINAVHQAKKGGSPMTPNIARKVLESFHKFRPSVMKDKLTDREILILNLLAEGKSYKKIAEQIFLSVDGVKYHIRSIYEKLQVNSRAEAVYKGQKLKILPKF
jgi:DNA-binding NarL/FixJ family response regulator